MATHTLLIKAAKMECTLKTSLTAVPDAAALASFSDASFDTVTLCLCDCHALGVLESHDTMVTVLSECARILKPGATLLFKDNATVATLEEVECGTWRPSSRAATATAGFRAYTYAPVTYDL